MKKIIFILVAVFSTGVFVSCKKSNYNCYDTIYDSLGNGVASTNGKVKRYFATESDMFEYQQQSGKSCIEIY